MLGQMTCRYFSKEGFKIAYHTARFDIRLAADYVSAVNSYLADVVINCIGVIKQYSATRTSYFDINARLPNLLASELNPSTILVHPSTDCVFKGTADGMYSESSSHDAEDDYGISKSMGELSILSRPKTLIIRTSVIGPDIRPNGPGLMAWLMRHSPGEIVEGYTNHYWNGITSLEWCKVVNNQLSKATNCSKSMVVIPGLNQQISKFTLLNCINDVYNLNLKISPAENKVNINRSMVPNYKVSELIPQLEACLEFSLQGNAD